MKSKIISITFILAALVFISITLVPHLLQVHHQEAANNTLVASHIYDSVKSCIEIPKTIAIGMSADDLLIKALLQENLVDEKVMEEVFSSYLTGIKEKFGYLATFIVSEETHRYYTPKGIAKVINPQKDPYDIWYKLFIDSGKDLDLDTDRDQVNDYRWTVFLNARITDKTGKLLGVCGIGLYMDDLQKIIIASEQEYDVKVNLIEQDGLVQVDTDSSNIENAYISEAIADKPTADDFTYKTRHSGGFRITRYMEDLEWILVVQGFSHAEFDTRAISIFVLIYTLLLAAIISVVFGKMTIQDHEFVKNVSTEDKLTGLPNRNYLNESYGELGVFNTTRFKTLVMFDIDRFKTTNETRDGDEIILGVVKCAKEAVGEKGLIFRWAGDEFVIFLEMDIDTAEEKFKTFCKNVKANIGVTVSVGLVEIDLSESIKKNYHRAVQPCYEVKEAGGDGVRRK